MTLVELMLVVFVLMVGIVSTLFFFSSTMLLTGVARDITVATTHAEYILEEMYARKGFSSILNTDWPQWARDEQLNTLPNETVEVDFINPGSDPLDVHVRVSWTRQNKPNKVDLYTKILRDENNI